MGFFHMAKPRNRSYVAVESIKNIAPVGRRAGLCLASLLIFLPSALLAQQAPPSASTASTPAASASAKSGPLNPAYLSQFPSVDQVMSQLKGTDAKDTINLELGTFRQLPQIIEDLAGQRWIHNQMTPDESRLIGAYTLAYNNLAKPLNFPFDNYFNQPALLTKLASTFSMGRRQPEGRRRKRCESSTCTQGCVHIEAVCGKCVARECRPAPLRGTGRRSRRLPNG
jgi:hypothetical protein